MSTLTQRDPAAVVARTLSFYGTNAAQYAANTLTLDLGAEQQQFLAALPSKAVGGARLLDAGCGSGRDTLAFSARGFKVTAFDGCAPLVHQARALTGLPVRHLRFDQMDYQGQFEGVWACASLLHLPPAELDVAMAHIHRALTADGAFYACFKVGEAERIDSTGRYFNDFTPARLTSYLTGRGFDVEAVTRSVNKLDAGTQWVNAFSRKRPA